MIMAANDYRPTLSDPEDPTGPGRTDDTDGTGVVTETRVKTKKPSMYRVLLLNDDYTPMEFVVFILDGLQSQRATGILFKGLNFFLAPLFRG